MPALPLIVSALLPPKSSRIRVELLRLVHANGPVSLLASGVLGLILAWGLSFSTPGNTAWVWSLLVCVVAAVLTILPLRFNRSLQQAQDEASSRRLTIVGAAVMGVTWGALPWLVMTADNPWGSLMIICTAAGVIAGSMSYLAPVWLAFACFSGFVALPMILRLLVLGRSEHYILALCAALYLLTLLAQSAAAALSFRRTIEQRFENAELLSQLRTEKTRAEDANLAKSRFLAAASHDLRQPIHAQGLFLALLAQAELAANERALLSHARAACAASGEMLNTLLDFSRIEAGVIEPRVEVFSLQGLLHKLEAELAVQADSKGILYRSRETALMARSDRGLVELIVRNLVSNAIRYTHRGGVLVGCRRRGARIMVEVWDTGIGIAPEHHAAVFREFHQLGNPERDRTKGLGLGLAIASALASKLGHALTMRSEPGRGSVFRLALPFTGDLPVTAMPVLPSPVTALVQLRVLVIEDDAAVRESMQQLLESWGCECMAVEDIADGLAQAQEHTPQLLISDYRLREQRTGAAAIAALRAQCGEQLPALLITGDTAPERLRDAQATGVPLLHKPVSPEALQQAILNAIG